MQVANLKGLLRVIEKLVMRPLAGLPKDILRAQVVCESMDQFCKVVESLLAEPQLRFIKLVDKFAQPMNGWADVTACVFFDVPENGLDTVVAEVQIVHDGLMTIREKFHAHDSYESGRFAAEILKIEHKETSFSLPHHYYDEANAQGQIGTRPPCPTNDSDELPNPKLQVPSFKDEPGLTSLHVLSEVSVRL